MRRIYTDEARDGVYLIWYDTDTLGMALPAGWECITNMLGRTEDMDI